MTLKERENNTSPVQHVGEWMNIPTSMSPTITPSILSQETVNGVTTYTMEWKWNTTSAWSPELHDGNHDLCLEWKSFDGSVLASAFSNVDLKNLTIPSVKNVENIEGGVIVWKDELQGSTVPLTVTVERYDITKPVDLTLTIYDTAMDPHIDSPIRTITATGVTLTSTSPTTGTYTFQWDGKKSDGVTFANPGTYTYDVRVSATDVYDIATYRSKYLKVRRALDDLGEPIYDVEYYDYDDGDTPEDDTDDSFVYVIRRYILADAKNQDAFEGVIWLYDPQGVKVTGCEWDIASLECLEEGHTTGDGLDASVEGIRHSVLVPVPASAMEYAGDYRFVLHIKDDNSLEYRDHKQRWALSLNAKESVIPINFYYGSRLEGSSTGGLDIIWKGIKNCWIKDYTGKYCRVARGYEIRGGKVEAMRDIPANEHASVVLSGLRYGGVKFAPTIFALYAHGLDGVSKDYNTVYNGKAMHIHKGRHNCYLTSNIYIDNTSTDDISQLLSLPHASLQRCGLAMIMGCHSAEGNTGTAYPQTLMEFLRHKGAATAMGFLGEIPDACGAIFMEKFFLGGINPDTGLTWDGLLIPRRDGKPGKEIIFETDEVIKSARNAAQYVQAKAASNRSGLIMPKINWVYVNSILDTVK